MKFDVVMSNPPFQDRVKRNRTSHKLWIDFTRAAFERLLVDGGSLLQVSPSSFASPNSHVLQLMRTRRTQVVRFGIEHHFPDVASTFSDYWIVNTPNGSTPTAVRSGEGDLFDVFLDESVLYLPNDLCRTSLSVHTKVMFTGGERLPVEWDCTSLHNSRRHDPNPILVTSPASTHPYPVFHTNRSTWWSSVRQPWADERKVMWTHSGHTKPFYDPGLLGGTDMTYFVRVSSDEAGENLARNLNSVLFRYIFATARWSGFGNTLVFFALPSLPDAFLDDADMYARFGLTSEEVDYVERFMAPRRRQTR